MQAATLKTLMTRFWENRRKQFQNLGTKGYFREHSHSSANPTILVKRPVWTVKDKLQSMESPGRPKHKLPGTHIGELSALKQTILLCGNCKKGFDWKKHGYYSVSHYDHIYAGGRCDVCRDVSQKLSLYLHEYHNLGGFMTRDRFRSTRLGKTIL